MSRRKLSEHVSTAFIYAGIGLMVGLLSATTIAIESGLPMAAFGRALISLGFVVLLALLLTAAMRAATDRPTTKRTVPVGSIHFVMKKSGEVSDLIDRIGKKAEQEKAFRKVGEGLADFYKHPERYPDAEEPPQPWMVGLTRKQHAEFRAAMDGPGDLVALVTTMRRANYDRIMARAARGDAPLVCMNHDGKWVDESAINWLRISMDEAAHIARVAAIKADQRAKSTFESTYGVNDPPAPIDTANAGTPAEKAEKRVQGDPSGGTINMEPWMVGLTLLQIMYIRRSNPGPSEVERMANSFKGGRDAVLLESGEWSGLPRGSASGMSDDARFEAGDLPIKQGTAKTLKCELCGEDQITGGKLHMCRPHVPQSQ